ncbi:P-loop NTPase [bacterium]|nr:P-loop NTPase [bacterium]
MPSLDRNTITQALSSISAHGMQQDIVSAGHVRNVQIFGDEVEIDVVCPSAALAVKKKLEVDILEAIQQKVYEKAKVKVRVSVLEQPAAPSIRGPQLPGVKHLIAVASGKGGVGKSTVAANLAVALSKMGFATGLIDADIHGPSMPLMFDALNERPGSIEVDGKRWMDPVEVYGVKMLSIGFFAGTDQAVVWRGPMATKALQQMIGETYWGELDFMIIDLPPGTGDVHLSLVQAVPLSGAVIVSTPQPVALADARKGIAMFQMDAINVPVLGLVENMAWFSPPDQPEVRFPVFGQGGVRHLSEQMNLPLLAEIPLVQSIREAGDVGRPAVLQENTEVSRIFQTLAVNTVEQLSIRNQTLPPTEVVRITTMAGCAPRKQPQH